jgi:hypothetical protein
MSVSVAVLKGKDNGAVLTLSPSQIHIAWWVVWIIQMQEWVKEQMQADQDTIAEMVEEEVMSRHGKELSRASAAEISKWRVEASAKVFKENRHLPRFECPAPAMLAMFDLRTGLRNGKKRRRETKDREGQDTDQDSDVKGGERRGPKGESVNGRSQRTSGSGTSPQSPKSSPTVKARKGGKRKGKGKRGTRKRLGDDTDASEEFVRRDHETRKRRSQTSPSGTITPSHHHTITPSHHHTITPSHRHPAVDVLFRL